MGLLKPIQLTKRLESIRKATIKNDFRFLNIKNLAEIRIFTIEKNDLSWKFIFFNWVTAGPLESSVGKSYDDNLSPASSAFASASPIMLKTSSKEVTLTL